METNRKILRCGISWKRLFVERKGRKVVTRVLGSTCVGGLFIAPIGWLWFVVIRCTLLNFLFYDFWNAPTPPISSNTIQTLYKVSRSRGNTGYYFVWRYAKNKQTNKQNKQQTNKHPPQKKPQQQQQHIKTKLWHIEFFLNTGPYETGNFKVLFLPQFSLKPIQFMRTMVTVTNLNAC